MNKQVQVSKIEETETIAVAVDRARQVKQGGSPEALLDTMMSMLANRGGALLPEEESQFVPLIRDMAARADQIVREHLAEQVAKMPNAPRGLYEFLAHEPINVARPVLVDCEAMDDQILVDVIEQRTPEHAQAIAGRPRVSAFVSSALIERGDRDSILILLDNPGADLPQDLLGEVVDRSRGDEPMQSAIVSRPDLPHEIAQKLFWNAGATIRAEVLDRFSLSISEIDAIMDSALKAAAESKAAAALRDDAARLTRNTVTAVKVSVADIIRALTEGHREDFIKSVSIRMGIRPAGVRKILDDKGGEALAVLCRALYADRTQFTCALLENDYYKTGAPRPPAQISMVSKVYDRIEPEQALATVHVWDSLLMSHAA